MTARGRTQKPKKVSAPAHPKANHIIIAHIDGMDYRAYVTHFRMVWIDPIHRGDDDVAWKLEFSYLISKKREKGIIAGWERKPHDSFLLEVLPANPNKYHQYLYHTYRGLARFNSVVEDKDSTPTQAHLVLDIVSKKIV